MEFKVPFISILLLSSWVFLGSSQMFSPCMTKLLPCKDFMVPSAEEPTDACCDPLKAMIKDDQACLCDVFNNAQLLKTLGVKQEDALKLPKACGKSVDITQCESSSDGEEASSLPPEVAQTFQALKDDAERRRATKRAAAAAPASDASGPSAGSGSSGESSAPSTSASTSASASSAANESTPSVDADSPSGGSNASSASRFAQGFGVLAISGVAYMALLN